MYKEAFASVINGINLSIELRRFRMLRNYCRQLNYIENISIHDRQSLYRHILNKVYDMHFQDFEYENLNNYLPEMQIPLHRITDSASNGSVFPVVTEHFSASSDHAFL